MISIIKQRFLNFYYSLSIKNKISISFIISFSIILIILLLFAGRMSSKILISKAVENTFQNIDLVIKQFDIVFDNAENYSKIAITDAKVQSILSSEAPREELKAYRNKATVREVLQNIIEPNTFIDATIIHDVAGNTYNSGGITINNPISSYISEFSSRDIINKWIDTRKSPYIRDKSDLDIISLLSRIQNGQTGRFIGMIEICIAESYLSDIYSNIKLGETGKIFIANTEGNVISSTDKTEIYSSLIDQPYFNWIKSSKGSKIFSINNVEHLLVCKHYARTGWIITGMVPLKEITGDINTLIVKLLIIGSICILSAAILSIIISFSISKPLIKLKETMKHIGNGDFEARVEVKSKDEVGILAAEFNKMIIKTSQLMNRILDEQRQKKERELALLQSQINPHFLYNTLESICGLAELNRNEDIIKTVNQLASFYRGVLSKGSNIIPVKDELAIALNYLRIIKMRYGDELEYSYEVNEEIFEYKTLKLILQPLIENSINHGLRNKRGTGWIKIKGFIDNGKVNLYVIDNGIGINSCDLERIFKPENTDYKTKSFGLKSTDERIKLYFGNDYGIKVDSVYGEGTTVKVILPAVKTGGEG